MPLNFDPNDPQVAQRLITGLPPVLPSLAKPQSEIAGATPSSFPGVRPVSPVADENSQRQFTGSLALKPQLSALTVTNPSAGLPPVTTPTPSPEEQRVASVRSKLQKLEQTPSATAGLWQKAGEYHAEHPGIIGRLGQVGAGILRGVDIAGETLMPNVARQIPGSGLNRSQNIAQTQTQLGEAEKAAGQASERSYRSAEADKAAAEAAKARKETELVGQPKPKEEDWEGVAAPGGGPVLNDQGQPLEREKTSGAYRWNTDVSGIKVTPKEGGPLSEADALQRNALWNPVLTKGKLPPNQFKAGMTPEQVKGIETALNQATGREQGQVHIDISEANLGDKLRKESEADAQAATQGRMNLYMQDGYNDAIKAWHQKTSTAQYAKDNVIITNLLNQEQSGNGALSGGVAGNMAVGSLIGGPTGAAVGGALGVFTNAINGPANAVLDSLKRQGLSNEGYAAMQAYLNALPARMAWELTTGGVKASTMRFGELLRKVIQTVPAPNTPKSAWDDSFQRYYKPMTTATEKKEQTFRLPKDYVLPTKEEFIPSGATGASGGEAPEGTRIQVGDKIQVKRGGKWVNE